MIIKGIAVPYNKISRGPAYTDGTRRTVAPNAFAGMANRPCSLQVGHEDDAGELASVEAGTLELTDSEIGLFFRAEIDPGNHPEQWLRNLKTFGASVNFIGAEVSEREIDGIRVRCVDRATATHIALVISPVYADAVCWNATTDISLYPPNVRQAAEMWERERAKVQDENRPPPATPSKRPKLSVEDEAAERKLAAMLAEYKRADLQTTRRALIPRGKKVSGLKEIAALFTRIYQERDRLSERIAELERRILALETSGDAR